ncbi:MAG: signal peptidase II [Bdellovibrionales bacterium]|nr:signal peptidase II [Bdellovibrionales bacterium]
MSNSFLKYFFVTITSFWILCLDQASKIYVHTQMTKEEPKVLIEGFFNISYVTNSGGVFGLFNNGPEGLRIFLFLLIPLACFVFIFLMLRDTKHPFHVIALSFILGGALGNYFDRLRLGYVVDFLDLYIGTWHWPTFNFADSFIVIGVSILSFFYIQEYRIKKNSK